MFPSTGVENGGYQGCVQGRAAMFCSTGGENGGYLGCVRGNKAHTKKMIIPLVIPKKAIRLRNKKNKI